MRRIAVPALAFGTAYSVAIVIGRASRLAGSEIALVWPAAAVVVLWAVYATGLPGRAALPHWILLCTLSVAVNLLTGASFALSAWFAGVNLTLALVAAVVLRAGERPIALADPADLVRLLVAVTAGSVAAALLATTWFAFQDGADLVETFGLFAVRNGVAALTGTAVALRLIHVRWSVPTISPARIAEGAATAAFVGGTFAVTFWLNVGLPLSFLPLVPALCVALRYSTTTSAVFLLAAGVALVSATLADHGPFGELEPLPRALLAQAMGGSLALTVLALALFRDSRSRLIEELEETRRQLVEDADLLAGVLDAASEQSIIATDEDGVITLFNRGAERMLGWTSDEMIGRTPIAIHLASEVRERASELGIAPGFDVFVHNVRPGTAETREWTYVRRDGSRLTVSLTVSAMTGPGDIHKGYIGVATDITARKRAEAELRRLAHHDPLTGLANRTLLMVRLDDEPTDADAGATGLIYIDLDGFKLVNDAWGHVEGDRVLIEAAARIRHAVRPVDTVARIGGDEFAVVVHGVSDIDALHAQAERIRLSLGCPYTLGSGRTFDRISASIGILISTEGATADALLDGADRLMYEAKDAGKNQTRAPARRTVTEGSGRSRR